MANSKAIVTLALGQKYLKEWQNFCQANWQYYAEKHGYDIICIENPLDISERAGKRSPSWQKCLILSQDWSQNYEQIVWVDADIMISPHAPCIVQGVPVSKVGVVDLYATPTPEIYAKYLADIYEYLMAKNIPFINNRTPQEFYKNYGLNCQFNQVVQAGVMVLSPQYHRHILEKTYFEYEDKGSAQWNYEMRPLSYELIKAKCVKWIDPRFNFLWSIYQYVYASELFEARKNRKSNLVSRGFNKARKLLNLRSKEELEVMRCIEESLTKTFFLHFAGGTSDMRLTANLQPNLLGESRELLSTTR